jgi:hypothetical protein
LAIVSKGALDKGERMSGMAINNASVIKHDYQTIESSGAVTARSIKQPVSASAHNVLHPCDKTIKGSGNRANLPKALKKYFRTLSRILTRLHGMWRHESDRHSPRVVPAPQPRVPLKPQVLPQPSPPMVNPQAGDLPDLSSKRNGAKANDIWGGFRQGPDGNCVTVSAIKAAMVKFGQSPTDIFKDVRKVGEGYQVVMRDGFALHLSRRELAEGAWGSKFVSRDSEMLKDAHFLFAASAKRAQLENNDGYAKHSFRAAIRSLNNGEDEYGPGEGLLRLGLKQRIKRVSVSELASGVVGMVNRDGHSVAVINGIEEQFGGRGGVPTHGDAIALR